ncbi:MAG: hypothetical protein QXJ94_03615 [Candidatus Bathyarchaeia archaeon]
MAGQTVISVIEEKGEGFENGKIGFDCLGSAFNLSPILHRKT